MNTDSQGNGQKEIHCLQAKDQQFVLAQLPALAGGVYMWSLRFFHRMDRKRMNVKEPG